MKIYLLIMSLFLVFVLTAGVHKSYALDYGVQTMTCGGEYAFYGAQNFYFGYVDEKGNCGVQLYYANSPDEAYNCAKKVCKDCRLEDLTRLYQIGSAMPGYNPGEQFCLGK